MKKLVAVVFVILFVVAIYLIFIDNRQTELEVRLSYSEETRYVTASAARLSPEYTELTYEFRGPELLTHIDTLYSEGVDTLIFEISGEGITEMVFYSIDPLAPNDTYAHAYRCGVSITDDVIDLDNRLWRR